MSFAFRSGFTTKGDSMATCKRCGKPIEWNKTPDGWKPYEVVGISSGLLHFKFCVQRSAGNPRMIVGKTITGSRFYEVDCNCGPPWEACEHSFPETARAAPLM